jgi:hypothetical protein
MMENLEIGRLADCTAKIKPCGIMLYFEGRVPIKLKHLKTT